MLQRSHVALITLTHTKTYDGVRPSLRYWYICWNKRNYCKSSSKEAYPVEDKTTSKTAGFDDCAEVMTDGDRFSISLLESNKAYWRTFLKNRIILFNGSILKKMQRNLKITAHNRETSLYFSQPPAFALMYIMANSNLTWRRQFIF